MVIRCDQGNLINTLHRPLKYSRVCLQKYHTATDLPNRSFVNQKHEDLQHQQRGLPLSSLCTIMCGHGSHHSHDRNETLSALGMQTTANLPTVQKAEEFNKPPKVLWFGLWCGVSQPCWDSWQSIRQLQNSSSTANKTKLSMHTKHSMHGWNYIIIKNASTQGWWCLLQTPPRLGHHKAWVAWSDENSNSKEKHSKFTTYS